MSDLHLGADMKRTGFAWLRGVATLDREFGAFLDWYAAHPEPGPAGDPGAETLPWRLIVNGDMVDFINVTLLPSADEASAQGFRVSDAERRFGLTGEEAKIAWMVDRVVDRHRPLFEKLAAFVGAGHELAIVRGNHDVEFHFPGVQARFRERLADVAGLGAGEARDAFLARISFLHWFYYEPGTIYVEHGHQYDEYSSFEYVLAPIAPTEPHRIDLPLSHFAIRYLANAFQNITTDDKDGWTLLDYFRFVATGKAGSIPKLLLGYLSMLVQVARAFVRRRLLATGAHARAHRERLVRLARDSRLSEEVLARLERLHRGSALRSLFCTMQCFYVDRFALIGLGLGVSFFLLADLELSTLAFALAAACLVLVAVGDRLLARARSSEIPPKLARAGHAIAVLVGVPLVVMGHSHHAQVVPVPGDEVRYVNTGTWIPPHGPNATREDAIGFTHVRVRRTAGALPVDAELRRWRPRRGPEKL